ncbi:MAG: hypothetical protein O3B13_25590 [Planctomycetota bacterium]|nr:hypothetical protein [Planctomycetota bacterium]
MLRIILGTPRGGKSSATGFVTGGTRESTALGDSRGCGLATRLTSLLIDESGDGTVHVRGAYSFIAPGNGQVEYRSQPEFFVSRTVPPGTPSTTPFFVDTDVIMANGVSLFAGELAATSGLWHAQSEVIYAIVDRQAATSVAFS